MSVNPTKGRTFLNIQHQIKIFKKKVISKLLINLQSQVRQVQNIPSFTPVSCEIQDITESAGGAFKFSVTFLKTGKYQMGTARTTLLIVLLCCTVEMNHAVPVPSATAPALPLETEAFTETYTEVVTDTVQSSDTEGAIQESQERPLTGPNDEPSTDTEQDDQQSSAQKGDNSDAIHQNDAQGDGPDDLSESDTDTGYDGTLLTSDKDDPEDDDTIIGGNDTHGTPHDAVNTTAQSTESTPKVLSARPLNTSSSSVSTSPMQGTQSNAQHDSASREVETAPQHHNSNPDVVSSTPDGLNPTQHHSESSPAHRVTPSMAGGLHHRTDSSQGSTSTVPVTPQQHDSSRPDGLNLSPKQTERSEALDHLTPSTSGISNHTTDLVPEIHHGESVNDEINPPVEAYVTELYTEIMERTELVMFDTESESDDTVSAPEEEDSEQRDIISEGEDESNYTSHDSASLMPMVVSSIPRNTDSTPQSTTYALHHSSAKPLAFADRMDTIPYDAGSSPSIIHSSSVDTDLTSIPFDYLSQASDVTQDEGTSLASAIVPSDTHQAPSSSTDNSIKRKEITPEPMETEIYTEIMQVTELVLSDAELESEDPLSASDQMGSEQSEDVAAAESDTSYTPKDYESSVMSVDESQFDDPLSASDQTGSEQSDISAAQSDISYIQRDYVTALMSAAESESDNTPSASGDDAEPEQSPEPVATKVYTEMIEVTELPVADATAKSDDTALAPDEDSEVRDNYSNEGHNNDDTPQVSPSSADNRSLFTPNAITSQPTPAPAQERTRETPNTSSTGPRSTRVDVTLNVTRSDTAESSPALTDTDSTPDGHDTTPKDSLNPSSANTESTLSEPRGAPDVVTSTMDIPGDNLALSQEPSMTEIYTETMEFTEILASNEKD